MAKIIMAMALKNEAETIEKAIRSAAHICDAAAISVDSLDTQGTAEIVSRICAELRLPLVLRQHVWADHFSNMRNGILEEAEALAGPGDWIFMFDGHEYVCPGHAHLIKALLERAPADCLCYSFTMKMIDFDGTWRDSFLQSKAWRAGRGIRYSPRAMHNQLSEETCPPETRHAAPAIWIIHDRPADNAKIRAVQRNQLLPELLEPRVTEDQDALFHMLSHYYSLRDFAGFMRLFELFESNHSNLIGECQYQIRIYAAILYAMESARLWDDAPERERLMALSFAEIDRAEQLVHDRNDHLLQRARNWYMRAEKTGDKAAMARALKAFELASAFPVPVSQSFAIESNYVWEPFACMGNCHETLGNHEDAWALYHIALQKGGGQLANNIRELEAKCAPGADWPDNGRPRLLIVDKLGQFTGDLANALSEWFNVRATQRPHPALLGAADAVFCDWVDDNAIILSGVRRKGPLIVRLHGYEAIEADYPARVHWPHVSALVGVSKQMIDYAERRFGALACEKVYIPNGLALDRFGYRKRARPHGSANIAWISMLNNKKNIGLLVLAARTFPQHVFHVAGPWQDRRLEEYFWESKNEAALDNLIYAGQISDVDAFLEDKDFLLNASLWESFSFAIHEAMAKGIKPLVHRWVSWDEYFPRAMTWSTMEELANLLNGPYESERYRAMAEAYDVRIVARRFKDLIERMICTEGNSTLSAQKADSNSSGSLPAASAMPG